MNLNEVLGTGTKVIDLVSRHLDTRGLLRLSLVCKQYERFQAKAFKEKLPTHVGIPHKKIKRISLSFCLIHTLHYFDFSNNQLTSIPREIRQLRNLTTLNLSHNQLSWVPSEIGQLRSLLALDLEHNQLTSIPSEIGQLISLLIFWGDEEMSRFVPSELKRKVKFLVK
jgi:Leucine-rich repeat (LRR) protein